MEPTPSRFQAADAISSVMERDEMLTIRPQSCTCGHMKTTIDLPDSLLHRAKIAAAERRTTLKELVIAGLNLVTVSDAGDAGRDEALARLRQGFHLGGTALTREQAHGRAPLP